MSLCMLAACAERISIALKSTAPAVAYDLGTKIERTITPGTEAHRRLAQWVLDNQEGWEPYVATPPALGIMVRAPELNIQFVGTSVIVETRKGVLSKKVTPAEYAFLLSQNGT